MREYLAAWPRTAYRSTFLYDQSYLEYYLLNGSSKHYEGTYWAKELLIDIDDKKNIENALTAARNIVARLEGDFRVGKAIIRIGFSGSKGFHLSLPQSVVGFGPSPLLGLQMIAWWRKIIEGCLPPSTLLDKTIYGANKLIRVPGSRNEKSGLYKTMLTSQELFSAAGISELQLMAQRRRPSPKYNPSPELNELLADMWPPESAVSIFKHGLQSRRQAVKTSGTGAAVIKPNHQKGIPELLRMDIKDGEGRNVAAFRIACHFAKRGNHAHAVERQMMAWNNGLSDPLPEYELLQTTRSALARWKASNSRPERSMKTELRTLTRTP